MKKKIFYILFSLIIESVCTNGQEHKRNNILTMGNIPVVKFNFNNNLQIDTVINTSLLSTPYCLIKSSSSCISDTNGGLLFFSNGFIIYDYEGYGMENGLYVNCPSGNVLANYYGASLFDQTSIILPKKGNTYYVFSTGMSDSVATNYLNHVYTEFDVLNYSIVDMDSNGGKGKVVQKNVVLADKQHYVNTAMQAVKHANGKDWWLVKADCINNRYQEFLVKEDTILGPYYQNVPLNQIGDFCYFFGQLYFNNVGSQMACSMYGHIKGGNFYYRNGVDIFDFDRCSGELTFKKYYEVPEDTISYPNYDIQSGICFSPNDSLLYMSNMYTVYQIDLYDTNTNNALFIHGPDTAISYFPWYIILANAPDGKMYIGNDNGIRKYMSYIDKPNVKGLGCDFVAQGVWQPYTNLKSPPNMPNYGLGKDTSVVCWPLGNDEWFMVNDELVVYPNPSNYKIKVESRKYKDATKQLYNSIGQLMLSTKENEIDVSTLPRGMYYLRVENQAVKVIVE